MRWRRHFAWAFSGLLVSLALVGGPSHAAYNDVQITADVNFQLPGSGIIIVAQSGANVASLTVNTDTIAIGMESGSSITLRSDEKRTLTVSPAIATFTCDSSTSWITLSSSSSQTVTLSVGAVCSTSTSSSSTSSSSGGAGLPPRPRPPTISGVGAAAIIINNGALTTSSREVALQFGADNVAMVLLGNTPDLRDAISWKQYQPTLPWTLSAGLGRKTVFAKFRSSVGGETAVVSDSIELVEEHGALPVARPSPTPLAPGVARAGELVKEARAPAVYLVENGKRRVFPSAKIFLAHGFAWSQVRTVPSLRGVPVGDPMDYPVRDGLLVKGSGPNVYLIQGGTRRLIMSADVFLGLGYQWRSITAVFGSTLQGIPEGEPIAQATAHVDGTLVKYAGSPNVYLIEGGKKRLIPSMDVFQQRGFRGDQILTIPDTFVYADGSKVGATLEPSPPLASGQVLGTQSPYAFTEELRRGSSGAAVLALQRRLKELGFFPATVTANGYFGPTTEAAVKRFQQAHGLPATGVLGERTRAALNGEPPLQTAPQPTPTPSPGQVLGAATEELFPRDLKQGDSGDDVFTLQQLLLVRGFFPNDVTPNGYYGPATAASVKRFQQARGLPTTGALDEETRAALMGLTTGR